MKQMKWTLGLVLLAGTSFAQEVLPTVYDTLIRSQEVIVSGVGEYSSTAIPNSFSSYFIRGGEIPDDEIDATLAGHQQLNRIGAWVQPELIYNNYNIRIFKKKEWGMQVKAGMLITGAGRYTDGLFGLAFDGNERYLGSTADLSNSVFRLVQAQKVGFGLIDVKSKSSVTLNVYGIRNYFSGYLNESWLQQDSSGSMAQLMLNGSVESAMSTTYFKGIGVGFDANFIFKVRAGDRPSFVQFQVQNLGVGFITTPVARYEMDTTLNYSGFEVADLVGDETVFNDGTKWDEEIGLKRDTVQSAVIALPFTIQIAKIIDEHNTKLVQSFFGVKVYGQSGAIPLVFAGAQLRPADWFRFGASLSYGGYTGLRGGLYVQAVWDQFNVGLSTNNIVGMVSKSGYGQAYSLGMSYRF